jgi:hypothetical protein
MSAFKTFLHQSSRQFGHLLLGAGLFAVSGISSQGAIAAASPRPSETPLVKAAASLSNGVYLYGQSAKPDQIGQAYFVFEVRQGKVLGALYMPNSSFDCAYGGFEREKLALNVVDSYEKTAYPYAIALDRQVNIASTTNPTLPQPGLEGFQKLTQVSQNDLKLLNTCKANYQAKVW